jgi:iron complex outermembrane receptor protein
MVGERFQVSEDIMVFGSYTEGFKSGGFFGRQANFDIDASYQPEYIDSYELGMKSTLMDGRMRFNPTLFLAKYKDKQESILVPVSIVPPNVATVVRNASVLDMFGVELELLFQVNDAFFVRATYGYLDAEYDNYLADLTGDQIVTDNSALVPRNAPENTLGLTGNYITSIGNGDLTAVVSWRYRDEAETIADNNALGHLDSITELSANVSYAWSDNRYRVTVFGRNMTDQRERKAGIIG